MADKTLIESLQTLQADATVFYQKLRHYHWHVHGPQFFQLHAKLEDLYDHWAEVIDAVAERILTVGGQALPTMAQVLSRATLKEDASFPEAKDMMVRITSDLGSLLATIQHVRETAEKSSDSGTVAMMDGMIEAESKTLWMLKAYLG